jgi:D-serine deaminase-like pyridoxal phosphate-dependent protein
MQGLDAIETPALVLEEIKLEANLARLRGVLSAWPQVELRPHMKSAKSLAVARRVLPHGGPITVSTLAEAEYFADHGFDDILYAVGLAPSKIDRAIRLTTRVSRLGVILDSSQAAAALAAAAPRFEGRLRVLIEIDSDGHRSGLRPNDPHLLAVGEVLAEAGLLGGILTHAGESYGSQNLDDLKRFAKLERDQAVLAADRLRAGGLECKTVSVGSTPTALFAQDLAGVTEMRAGVYMFQDLVMAGAGVCRPEDIALSVLCEVIGHQADRGWVIVDAGWMALSRDRGTQRQAVDQGYGLVCDIQGRLIDDLVVINANQEHGVIARRDGAPLQGSDFPVGARLRVLPNHACATAAQHRAYALVRDGHIVDHWERFGGW